MAGAAPGFEETEPVMEERVEPSEEATLIFRKALVYETSAANKGEGEVVAPTKKKKPVSLMKNEGN